MFLAAGLLAACAGGCSSRDQKSAEIKSLEGIADEIDLENNRVSMRVTDGKGGERVIEGTFREDTEVVINGRRQRLEDVRPGDRVLVFGFREGDGTEARLVATKVVVTRPTATDWKATGKASETEAGSPSAASGPPSRPAASNPPSQPAPANPPGEPVAAGPPGGPTASGPARSDAVASPADRQADGGPTAPTE